MDPMEDFSFKPITEGLGFHRKKSEPNESVKLSRVTPEPIGNNPVHRVAPKPESQFSKPTSKIESQLLKNPLPKRDNLSVAPTVSSVTPVAPTPPSAKPSKDVIDEIVKNFKKPNESFVDEKSKITSAPKVIINPIRPELDDSAQALPWMVTAFFIDAMLVVALSVSALLATLVMTDADLTLMIDKNLLDQDLWVSFLGIGITMIFSYMSLSRLMMGASIGEMVFEVQLGTTEQRQDMGYNFRVLMRSFLAIMSGLLVIPLFSLIMRQDYLGDLCGLRLYKVKRRGK
ncbi:MAG: hypothetical protein RJB66_1328 [Pseudomonadota bacterium]|jgi:hypothetical protein